MSGAGAGAGGVRSRGVFEAGASNGALLPLPPVAPRIPDSVVGTWVDLLEAGGAQAYNNLQNFPSSLYMRRGDGMLDGKETSYSRLIAENALAQARLLFPESVDAGGRTKPQLEEDLIKTRRDIDKYSLTEAGKQEKRVFEAATFGDLPGAVAEAALLRRRHLLSARALQQALYRKAGGVLDR